jgi:hypothetical protein
MKTNSGMINLVTLVIGVTALGAAIVAAPFRETAQAEAGNQELISVGYLGGGSNAVETSGDDIFFNTGDTLIRAHQDKNGIRPVEQVSLHAGIIVDIALTGGAAFVVTDAGELAWVDITTDMAVRRTVQLSGSATTVFYGDDLLYVGVRRAAGQGIDVIRKTVDGDLVPVSILDTQQIPWRIDRNAGYLYVANRGGAGKQSGIQTFDLQDPGTPQPLKWFGFGDLVVDMVCTPEGIVAASGPAGITLIDNSEPSDLKKVTTYYSTWRDKFGVAMRVIRSDDDIVVLGGAMVKDQPVPGSVTMIRRQGDEVRPVWDSDLPQGNVTDVALSDAGVVISSALGGLYSVKPGEFGGAPDIEVWRSLGSASRLASAALDVFASDRTGLVYRVQTSEGSSPRLVSTTSIQDKCQWRGCGIDLTARDGKLMLASKYFGLSVIDDMNGVHRTRHYTQTSVSDDVWSVEYYGGRAYVSAGLKGITAIDVPDTGDLKTILVQDNIGYIADMEMRDSRLYALRFVEGGPLYFAAFDLTNPDSIGLLGFVAYDGLPGRIRIAEDRAYVSDGETGVHVFDVGDAQPPKYLGAIGTGTKYTSVATNGQIIVLGTNHKTVEVWSVDSTNLAVKQTERDTRAVVEDVVIIGRGVYTAEGGAGLGSWLWVTDKDVHGRRLLLPYTSR